MTNTNSTFNISHYSLRTFEGKLLNSNLQPFTLGNGDKIKFDTIEEARKIKGTRNDICIIAYTQMDVAPFWAEPLFEVF